MGFKRAKNAAAGLTDGPRWLFINRQFQGPLKCIKKFDLAMVVGVKWSACSPFTLTIRVRFPMKSTAFLYNCFEKGKTNYKSPFYIVFMLKWIICHLNKCYFVVAMTIFFIKVTHGTFRSKERLWCSLLYYSSTEQTAFNENMKEAITTMMFAFEHQVLLSLNLNLSLARMFCPSYGYYEDCMVLPSILSIHFSTSCLLCKYHLMSCRQATYLPIYLT